MTYLGEITTGFDPFRQHLFRTQYTWSRLREDAAEVKRVLESM